MVAKYKSHSSDSSNNNKNQECRTQLQSLQCKRVKTIEFTFLRNFCLLMQQNDDK